MTNVKFIIITILACIVTCLVTKEVTQYFISVHIDNDYKKLGEGDITYYTTYNKELGMSYKIYNLSFYDSDTEIINQLEKSKLWTKNKFFEYVMQYFYERINGKYVEIDREKLYFYHHNGIYAIFDYKNWKLYYLTFDYLESPSDNINVKDIRINNYIYKEVYDVRGGWQGDGIDYYVYKFTIDKGKEIVSKLSASDVWDDVPLEDNKLKHLHYNAEVFEIKNGYYYFDYVCRTSDDYKKRHCNEEFSTGYEVGVYDVDNNILYYIWTSI